MSDTGKTAPEYGTDLLWDSMCGPEVTAVNRYLEWCAKAVGVSHWRIYLSHWPADDEHAAECETMDQRYVACVAVNRDWVSREPAEQAMVLLHEVLHVSHHWVTAVVTDELPLLAPGKFVTQCDYLAERIRVEGERMVDQLSVALADSLSATEVWNDIRRTVHAPAPDEEPIPYFETPVLVKKPKLRAVATDKPDPA